jgi:hypothetical protein
VGIAFPPRENESLLKLHSQRKIVVKLGFLGNGLNVAELNCEPHKCCVLGRLEAGRNMSIDRKLVDVESSNKSVAAFSVPKTDHDSVEGSNHA